MMDKYVFVRERDICQRAREYSQKLEGNNLPLHQTDEAVQSMFGLVDQERHDIQLSRYLNLWLCSRASDSGSYDAKSPQSRTSTHWRDDCRNCEHNHANLGHSAK